MTYSGFCRRCGAEPVARAVKLTDIADKMDPGRIPAPTPRDHARMERYEVARRMLLRLKD